jgi:hypothetical protein
MRSVKSEGLRFGFAKFSFNIVFLHFDLRRYGRRTCGFQSYTESVLNRRGEDKICSSTAILVRRREQYGLARIQFITLITALKFLISTIIVLVFPEQAF